MPNSTIFLFHFRKIKVLLEKSPHIPAGAGTTTNGKGPGQVGLERGAVLPTAASPGLERGAVLPIAGLERGAVLPAAGTERGAVLSAAAPHLARPALDWA